jgi:hypothetical protein
MAQELTEREKAVILGGARPKTPEEKSLKKAAEQLLSEILDRVEEQERGN